VSMFRQAFFVASLALIAPLPANAQTRPSFDCAKSTEDVEKAICKSGNLSKLDRAIASAYAQARRTLDPESQAALQEDQESFLSARATALAEDSKSLMEFMQERLKLLRGMIVPPSGNSEAAFLGQWHNNSGFVRITRAAGGKLKVGIETSTPVTGMRACGAEQTAALKDGKLTFRHLHVTVSIKRKAGVLEVEEDGGDIHLVCGQGSWLRGTYFRANWPGTRELPR
jgi:uncharacterized protein